MLKFLEPFFSIKIKLVKETIETFQNTLFVEKNENFKFSNFQN